MESSAEHGLLRATLGEVASRVHRYRSERIGEQNTKAALVVPVLRALRWDVEDLDEVQLEYRQKGADKPVDYALMLQREPVLFVEAKALGEDLSDRRWASQVISYAAVAGVEWVVLTNGDEYRIYNAHAPVPVDEKLLRAVRVTADPAEAEDALRLLNKEELRRKSLAALWRAQSIDNRVRRAVEELFEPEPSAWLVRRLASTLEGLTTADVKAALVRARLVLDFPPAEPSADAAQPAAARTSHPSGRTAESQVPPRERRAAPARFDATVKDLLDAGLLCAGAELRRTYLGREVKATVERDGRIRFRGDVYNSLSTAAGAARVAVKGPPTDGRRSYQTNGWTFWEFEDAAGERRELQALRERLPARR